MCSRNFYAGITVHDKKIKKKKRWNQLTTIKSKWLPQKSGFTTCFKTCRPGLPSPRPSQPDLCSSRSLQIDRRRLRPLAASVIPDTCQARRTWHIPHAAGRHASRSQERRSVCTYDLPSALAGAALATARKCHLRFLTYTIEMTGVPNGVKMKWNDARKTLSWVLVTGSVFSSRAVIYYWHISRVTTTMYIYVWPLSYDFMDTAASKCVGIHLFH